MRVGSKTTMLRDNKRRFKNEHVEKNTNYRLLATNCSTEISWISDIRAVHKRAKPVALADNEPSEVWTVKATVKGAILH